MGVGAVRLGTGSSGVLGAFRKSAALDESARSLARSQPFCTNVSFPSGRTSLTVACRSTSGVDDRTQRSTAPPPITVVSLESGGVTYERDVPAGFCCQSHCQAEALLHRPPESVLVPA